MTTTTVSSGQTLSGAMPAGGDMIFVMSGGATVDTTLLGSAVGAYFAQEYVLSGGVASGTVIDQVGLQVVSSGGLAVDTVISGGIAQVDSGGVLSGTTFTGTGVENLIGGTASGTILGSGDSQRVINGVAVGTVVESGGNQTVYDFEGVASGTTVSAGGVVEAKSSSVIVDATVLSGGSAIIFSGTTISGLTVSSGGSVLINSGGEIALTGALPAGVFVRSGGLEGIGRGVAISGLAVHAGAILVVSSGGTAANAIVESGGTIDYAGGRAPGVRFDIGGHEAIVSGSTVNGLVVGNGVDLTVSGEESSATNTTVLSGGTIVFDGGAVIGLSVRSGGQETIDNDVTVGGLNVSSGVALVVSVGALATDTQISGGILRDSGETSGTVIARGVEQVLSFGITAGTTVDGGAEVVMSGGRADAIDVSGGRLSVASGATVDGARLTSGTEVVLAGGTISGTTTFGAHGTLSVAARNSEPLTVRGFRATDTIDLTDFKFGAAEKLSFTENIEKTAGTLTVTDGALKATITLFGQYVAAGFHHVAAGAGTAITYSTPPAGAAPELVAGHM